MLKPVITILFTLLLLVPTRPVTADEMLKEGTDSGRNYATGTSKAIPMGEERIQVNYEGSGIYVGDTEKGFLNNASIHFLGSLNAIKGVFEESGGMV